MLPTYILVAALMTAVGSTVTQASEGQQVTGMFILPIMVPYWFVGPIMLNPNGPLAIALSFFPLTAPVTLTLRAAATTIPFWQIALNAGLLILAAAGAMRLSSHAFQLGMLRYGQRLNWREIFQFPTRKGH